MEKKAGWLIKLQKARSAQDGDRRGWTRATQSSTPPPEPRRVATRSPDGVEPNLVKPQESQIPAYGPDSGRASERGTLLRAGPVSRKRGGHRGAGPVQATIPRCLRAKLPGELRWAQSSDCQAWPSRQGVPAAEHVRPWVVSSWPSGLRASLAAGGVTALGRRLVSSARFRQVR